MRLALVVLVALTGIAHADYQTEQATATLGEIERALDFAKPDWFDGSRVTTNVEARWADMAVTSCTSAAGTYERKWSSLPASVQSSDRGRAVQRRYGDLSAYCKALAAAVAAHRKGQDAKAAQQASDAKAEAALQDRRVAFYKDLSPVATQFLTNFVRLYDEKLKSYGSGGATDTPEFYASAKQGYLAVREVCKRHQPLVTNPTTGPDATNVLFRPIDACAMADRGEELVQTQRRRFALQGIRYHTDDLLRTAREFLNEEKKELSEEMQLLVFDQPAFVALANKEYVVLAAKIGEKVPADAWDPAFARNAELKAKIDEYGAVAFDMPKFHDKAAEGAARSAFAKAIKGVKVRKMSTEWAKWNVWDENVWVGSDAMYDYYKVNKGKNKYMRGAALVEIPGRPYCQVRRWEAARAYNGPITISPLDPSGTFAKCE